MSEEKDKKKKPVLSRFTYVSLIITIVLIFLLELLTSPSIFSGTSYNTVTDTTNHVLQTRPPEFLHCLETLPIEYMDDYHSLIKEKPEPVDYKAACEIILKKIENDKAKGNKE